MKRFTRKFTIWLSALCLILTALPAYGQFSIAQELKSPNEEQNGRFGNSVSDVGDVNNDGYADLLVGAFLESPGSSPIAAGRAYVLSGFDGSTLYELQSPNEKESGYFGYSVSGAGDVDNDGTTDLLVGERDGYGYGIGRAYVFSGADGSLLYELQSPNSGGNFSWSVSDAGDVNNDGFADLIVGAPHENIDSSYFRGRAYVFNGLDGSLLYQLQSPRSHNVIDPADSSVVSGYNEPSEFGWSVSGAGDVNNDGFADLLVGAPQESPGSSPGNPSYAGCTYVFSGETGNVLYTLKSPNEQQNGNFGWSVSDVRDVNNDGHADLLVGAYGESTGNSPGGAGRAYVFSGKTGNVLHTLQSPNEHQFGYFGSSVSDAGDVNNDGVADLLVSPRNEDANGSLGPGRAYVFSGADGNFVYELRSPKNSNFGWSVSGAGDVDNDGVSDILVGAPYESTGSGTGPGRAYVFFGGDLQNSVSISGTKFRDTNGNCIQDPGEAGLLNWVIRLQPGNIFTTTDINGNYAFSSLPSNITYTLSTHPRAYWQQTCSTPPGTHTVTPGPGQNITNLNFGSQATANVQDLCVSVAGGPARPGFTRNYGIRYENVGTVAVNATVTLKLPPQTTYLHSSNNGAYTSGPRLITWNVGLLPPGFIGHLTATVQISPSAPLGVQLTSIARINPVAGDATPSNNIDIEKEIVRGSYDPNDKQVTPVGIGSRGIIATNDTLDYKIRFQNTGTDTAFNVVVRDTLHPLLDISSLAAGASSHPYTLGIIPPNELVFTFANIQLPDSNVNEPASHGFVKFSILPRPDAQPGDEIENRAAIYFDFNLPIITNTVRNRFASPFAEIALSPRAYYFGELCVSAPDTQIVATVTVLNEGLSDLNVNSVDIVGASAAEFSILSGSSFTLGFGETQDIAVRFAPSTEGVKSATVLINSNDADTPVDSVSFFGIVKFGGDGPAPFSKTLLSATDIEISGLVLSGGDMHANDDITFNKGLPGEHDGNLSAVNNIRISSENMITGDVTAGGDLTNSGLIIGAANEHAAVDAIALPALAPFSAGSDDVTVAGNTDSALVPGSYADVIVGREGTLRLISGEYFMDELTLGTDSKLIVDADSGAVVVNIVRDLDFGDRMVVSVSGGSERFTFNSLQSKNIDIDREATVVGSIIAPNAKLRADSYVHFRGAICAKDIRFTTGPVILNHASAQSFPKRTLVVTENEDVLPKAFRLAQNYPNPFNPTTQIEFQTTDFGFVELKVYDIAGRLVKTLVDENLTAGSYTVHWNARNDFGQRVASGIYFYKLISGSRVAVKKMILLK